MKKLLPLAAALIPAVFLTAQIVAQTEDSKTKAEVEPAFVPLSKVEWGALNPARGAAGPRAGNLWGDRTGDGATGFLVKFADGFSSPPHIHNVTYRGMVISGEVHNDDPDAAEMWMPPGSYWTQPAGEVHITAAKGENVVAYIEIQEGPYLVMPADEATDNGERPINVDASNLVWLGASDTTWIDAEGAEIAFLWGNPQDDNASGSVVKLPAGFTGKLVSDGASVRAIVIGGNPKHEQAGKGSSNAMEPGDYFGSDGEATHHIISGDEEESTIYVRTEGKVTIIPTLPED